MKQRDVLVGRAILLAAGVLVGVSWGSHSIAFISLCLLAGTAILPRENALWSWPVGFASVIGLGYAGYLVSWFAGGVVVNSTFAWYWALILCSVFAVVSLVRGRQLGNDAGQSRRSLRWIETAVVSAIPVVLVAVVTLRWNADVGRLVSGHMAGGDHGAHNSIVHALTRPELVESQPSPFALYTYPRGLHFVIANLLGLSTDHADLPLLMREYGMGAWFEWIQLAAYVQLAGALFVRSTERVSVRRMVILPAAGVAFMAMDNFISHLFWSGFTTSLGMTWILLLPFFVACCTEKSGTLFKTVSMFAVGIVAWIVYPPYTVPIVVAGGSVALFHYLGARHHLINPSQKTAFAAGTVSFASALALLIYPGESSPAVKSLILDGSTYKPALWTVVFWFVLSVIFAAQLEHDASYGQRLILLTGLVSVGSFTFGLMMVVSLTSDFGLFNQPYYTQKMLWILLFVCIPVGSRLVADVVDEWLGGHGPYRRLQLSVIAPVVILLAPLLTGRFPVAAFQHFKVDWFVAGLKSSSDIETSVMAFSSTDKLGSHMANLALGSSSMTAIPVTEAISGNAHAACRYILSSSASSVLTTPNGRAELVASGCDPSLRYFEDGVLQEPIRLDYFSVREGDTETFTEGSLGFRLLLRGFLPPEKWGTWAGGYRSALGFDYEDTMKAPSLKMVLRSHPRDEELRSVSIGVNGATAVTHRLAFGDPEPFVVPLPAGPAGTSIELTITCERTDAEVLADDPVDGPSPCAGLVSMRLVERGD